VEAEGLSEDLLLLDGAGDGEHGEEQIEEDEWKFNVVFGLK